MEHSPLSSLVVLIVDDDEDTRLNLRDILELDGYRVELASSAGEILRRTDWDGVSVVLLDRKLPDGTPQEVVPQVKQRAPAAAIIIVTGYADVEGAIMALQSGAADYILKPVNADALRASVRRVLQRQHDAREIARLSQELAGNEARYRALFENALDGLLIVDDQGRIVDCNPAACGKLGVPDTLRNKGLNAIRVVTSDGPMPVRWSDFFDARTRRGELRVLRGDGQQVDLEYRSVSGFAPGLNLISMRDVTARKRAEERARQVERLAAIGETMAALVHESRNALQRSKACLEMLTLDLEGRPESLQLVERAQRAQDDLHRLFEEVRQWAAPLHLRCEPCDLRELWREVWTHVRQAHAATCAPLQEEVLCPAICRVDRFAMAQVFRNIFENALEASPVGAAVMVRCCEQSAPQGGQLVITIRDQGPGLTPQQQRRIFEPFFTTKAKGTGLGMAIAARIVHAHGGTIVASSPRGAEIEITLPRGTHD